MPPVLANSVTVPPVSAGDSRRMLLLSQLTKNSEPSRWNAGPSGESWPLVRTSIGLSLRNSGAAGGGDGAFDLLVGEAGQTAREDVHRIVATHAEHRRTQLDVLRATGEREDEVLATLGGEAPGAAGSD